MSFFKTASEKHMIKKYSDRALSAKKHFKCFNHSGDEAHLLLD